MCCTSSSGKILLHYTSLFTVTTLWGSKNEASTVIGTRVGCGPNTHNPRMQNAALHAHFLQPQQQKKNCLFMGNGYSNWKKAASKDSGSRQVKMSRSATGICTLFHFNRGDPNFEGKLGTILTKIVTTEQKINLIITLHVNVQYGLWAPSSGHGGLLPLLHSREPFDCAENM